MKDTSQKCSARIAHAVEVTLTMNNQQVFAAPAGTRAVEAHDEAEGTMRRDVVGPVGVGKHPDAPADAAPTVSPEAVDSYERLQGAEEDGRPVGSRKLMAALLGPVFMALVAISMVNVALSPMRASLGATNSLTQWVVSGYALSFGVPLVAAGRIGDVSGRRRMFSLGVGLFTLGSLLSALAPSIGVLIGARVLQGLGAGLFNPQTTGIIQANFTGQARARAYAMFGTTVAIATVVGPLLGGFLIQAFGQGLGWRMMFMINVPMGLATLAIASRWIPDDRAFGATSVAEAAGTTDAAGTNARPRRMDLDPVGMVLLAVAILAILFPFVQRSTAVLPWVFGLFGAVLAVVFVRWEASYKKRSHTPMLDLDLVRAPAFCNGIFIVTLFFLGNTSVWLIVPIYLQNHLGTTALVAAMTTVPASVVSGFAAPWAGRHVLHMGRKMVIGGYLVSMTAVLATLLVINPVESGRAGVWWFALSLLGFGIGSGLVISPNQTLTLASVRPEVSGVAGGVLSLGQRMGTAIGTALISSILFGLVEAGVHWNIALSAAFGGIFLAYVGGLAFTIADFRREARSAA